jgi:protein-L-isoaspartate(D-aspartate) O-methyltransferase
MRSVGDRTDPARRMVARLGPLPAPIAIAMRTVPRDEFVPSELRDRAYDDEPLPLPGDDATISAPHMVAILLEYVDPRPGDKVLDIGTGFGYLAALAAEMVGPNGRVVTVELDPHLAWEAQRRLDRLGYTTRVTVRTGDGRLGVPSEAPFDRIVVSCATPRLEAAWIAQLAPNGTIVAPLGGPYEQQVVRYRAGAQKEEMERGPSCRFVALRPAKDDIYRPEK